MIYLNYKFNLKTKILNRSKLKPQINVKNKGTNLKSEFKS